MFLMASTPPLFSFPESFVVMIPPGGVRLLMRYIPGTRSGFRTPQVRLSRTCQTVPEEALDTDHELTGFVRTREFMSNTT